MLKRLICWIWGHDHKHVGPDVYFGGGVAYCPRCGCLLKLSERLRVEVM